MIQGYKIILYEEYWMIIYLKLNITDSTLIPKFLGWVFRVKYKIEDKLIKVKLLVNIIENYKFKIN